jgi:hypothetical protein
MRSRGLNSRRRMYYSVSGQLDRLLRQVPDREYRTEDEDEIGDVFKYGAFFVFRTNQQRVGRFEALGWESSLFHNNLLG